MLVYQRVLGIITPIDEVHHFSEGFRNHQSVVLLVILVSRLKLIEIAMAFVGAQEMPEHHPSAGTAAPIRGWKGSFSRLDVPFPSFVLLFYMEAS